ncbi:uncharacterized protein LOC123874143 isoform X3 [Maniola jurtina]|uniref:uncharacterized protein LOC123874143 isoform X3 n=1 Tax=Maniola jurtina TaxID=191418 RepID=UPI001E68E48C|nr:uncharacterized protein LOC123874143 isoform X3 [Maniola jurtina]
MAINSHEKLGDKIGPATKSSCSKSSNQSSRGLLKNDYSADGSISSSNCDKSKSKKNLSPYLTEGRVQMLSRITEKRLVSKKTTDFPSSYPLAINIYKASSDEFKALKKSKKVKKSVLTLPNEPAPLPQACTVSDMNDSEYFDDMKHERTSRPKKRRTQTNRRPRMNKAMEVFDRDAEYCSRLNIDLDNSSTEMINQFTGDGKKISIKCRNKKPKESAIKAHDVWAMLKNMNRFPFRSSPPLSDESIASIKRNTYNKRRNSRMDTKFIETCTTEEFTFFSNSNKSAHNSQSSIDRITVIDKQNEYQELCEQKVIKNKIPLKIKNQKNDKKIKSNVKAKCGKVISDGGDNDKFFHHNDVNLKLRNELSNSLRNKAQGQESKLMLPNDANNHTKMSTYNRQKNTSRKDSKEFYVSEDHLTSDSSNGYIIKDQTTSKKINSCDLQGPINGITKVVLSKGPNIVLTKKDDNLKRQPHSVKIPSAALYPKLTQTEINRRLANIKSPLDILAKDQLTAAPCQIKNYEPPQYVELDEHNLPFMQDWQTKCKKAFKNPNEESNSVYEKSSQDVKGDYARWNRNDMRINKGKKCFLLKDKTAIQPVLIPNAKNINNKVQKTVAQFKEIIDSDCKKCIPQKFTKQTEVDNNSLDVNTNTQRNLVFSNEQNQIISKKEKMLKYKMPSNMKQPCGKGSWASEFIDNVIKKLKSGVYYNQDEKDISRNPSCKTKEGSVQTEINFAKHDYHSNEEFNSVNGKPSQGIKGDYVQWKNNDVKIDKGKKYLPLRDKTAVQPVLIRNAKNINNKAQKTIPQFKEIMLQFLHNKPPSSFDSDCKKCIPQEFTQRTEVYNNSLDVSTNTQCNLVSSNEKNEIFSKKEKMLKYNIKQSCAKGSWANEFIDNIIKKLKSGVYYNQDEKDISRNRCCLTKEESVQTETNFAKHDLCKDCIQKSNPVIKEINNCDIVSSLPGFEDQLSDLKIESIDQNQIAIKHCITNIIVQFDVATPSQIDPMLQAKQSISCIPMSVTESNTNIFKSKTIIVNAMLPAELCSILPKIMRKIVDSKVVIPKIVDKVDSHLSTIAELTRCESGDSIKQLIPAHIEISPEIRSLGQGNFSKSVLTIASNTSDKIKTRQDYFEELHSLNIADPLANINTNLLFICQIDPMALLIYESQQSTKIIAENHLEQQKTSICMELKPYLSSNKQSQIIPAFPKLNFIEIAARIFSNQNFSTQLSMPIINQLNDLCYKNNVNIISVGLNTDKNKAVCIISDVMVDSLYNDFQEHLKDSNGISSILKLDQKHQITDRINKNTTDRSQINKLGNFKSGVEYCVTNSKNKKRSFVKLYKKCKSMSSISNERSSTALQKITNLDEFFLALGSAKTLTSVFDESVERKILTSIKEMKSWINEITPRQALLVLLLANKKDTSNLVRYRPVILQGIAVKRITRASELDMEIEVIARENLNTFSQASDYQKPFDESSERLLKSLLEKRKKLNPSYLRVMARYVGLGLVKSPK